MSNDGLFDFSRGKNMLIHTSCLKSVEFTFELRSFIR